MHSLREVRTKFEEMIDRQKKMLDALATEKQALSKDRQDAEGGLSKALEAFIPDLDAARLETLSGIVARNFTAIARELAQADDANRREYADIGGRRETPTATDLQALISQHQQAVTGKEADEQAASLLNERVTTALQPVTDHNALHPDYEITDGTKEAYAKLNAWKYATDSGWRSAYKAVRDYRSVTDTIAGDVQKTGETSAAVRAAQKEIKALNGDIETMRADAARMAALDTAYKGPEAILETVRAAAQQELVGNDKFSAALAEKYGEDAVKPLALAALKVRNLDKIDANLDTQETQAEATLKKLEDPMGKIRRGARNAPSKKIEIDLDGIEKAVNTGRAYAGYNLVSSASARNAVSTYQPAHDDSMFNFTNLMLLYMLMENHTDAAYSHHTFGIDQNTASQANIDMHHLAPDISGTLAPDNLSCIDGLSQHATDALQGIDCSTLPQISVPDTSTLPDPGAQNLTPDFNGATVPDAGIPNVDSSFNAASVPDFGANIAVPDSVQVPDFQIPSMPDISTSVPDFSSSIPSIPDISVSVPDISVSVPDFSMPSMPDISISMPDTSSFTMPDTSSFSMPDTSSFSSFSP